MLRGIRREGHFSGRYVSPVCFRATAGARTEMSRGNEHAPSRFRRAKRGSVTSEKFGRTDDFVGNGVTNSVRGLAGAKFLERALRPRRSLTIVENRGESSENRRRIAKSGAAIMELNV